MAALNARRAALGEKLSRKRAKEPDKSPAAAGGKGHDRSALAMGFRLSADFLSAILVGGVLGLALDKFAGISPWGLLIFLLLGFAAGVVNILRSLGQRAPYGKEK